MADYNMDVDPPYAGKCSLKRSNSAPIINILVASNNIREETVSYSGLFDIPPRTRRFSASCSSGALSPSLKIPSRISQIKHEEGMDVVNREAAREREVQSNIQMCLSCEDLTLSESLSAESSKRPRNYAEPLQIFPPAYPLSSSPSPTRIGKQCFSPSLQQPVKDVSFCPSPIPSPTRKSSRRSLSPIAVRPSQFPVKRKCDLEQERLDSYMSPPKRFFSSISASDKNLVVPHPLAHSLSSSSLEESSSPEQSVPVLAAGTPESLSSVDSPCGAFKPMDNDAAMMQDSAPPTPTMMSVSQEASL